MGMVEVIGVSLLTASVIGCALMIGIGVNIAIRRFINKSVKKGVRPDPGSDNQV